MDSLIFILYFSLQSNAFVKIYFVLQNLPALIPGSCFIGPLCPLTDLCRCVLFCFFVVAFVVWVSSFWHYQVLHWYLCGWAGCEHLLTVPWLAYTEGWRRGVASSPPGSGAVLAVHFLTQPCGARALSSQCWVCCTSRLPSWSARWWWSQSAFCCVCLK